MQEKNLFSQGSDINRQRCQQAWWKSLLRFNRNGEDGTALTKPKRRLQREVGREGGRETFYKNNILSANLAEQQNPSEF